MSTGPSENLPFEGVEKRIIIEFRRACLEEAGISSLRNLSDVHWQRVLDFASCYILSKCNASISDYPIDPEAALLSASLRKKGRCAEAVKMEDDVSGCTAYLLSESSLFVFDSRIVIKTCGTTTPLLSIDPVLHLVLPERCRALSHPTMSSTTVGADGVDPSKKFCPVYGSDIATNITRFIAFSHLNFKFPERQVFPHRSFDEELRFLEHYYPDGESFLLPTTKSGRDLHIFLHAHRDFAQGLDGLPGEHNTLDLTEIMMTGISTDSVARFAGQPPRPLPVKEAVPGPSSESGDDASVRVSGRQYGLVASAEDCDTDCDSPRSAHVGHNEDVAHDIDSFGVTSSLAGGRLKGFLPFKSTVTELDQFWFSPCGYSCNLLHRGQYYLTSHISPEADASYASVEVSVPFSKADADASVSDVSTASSTSRIDAYKSYHAHDQDFVFSHFGKLCIDSFLPTDLHLVQLKIGGNFGSIPEFCVRDLNDVPGAAAYKLQRRCEHAGEWFRLAHAHYRVPSSNVVGIPDKAEVQNLSLLTRSAKMDEILREVNGERFDLDAQSTVCGEECTILAEAILHPLKPLDEAVLIINLQRVIDQFDRWTRNLPRIKTHYAVKCNSDMVLLRTLSALGSNFDCASPEEMKMILKLGRESSDIIYSNPCKQIYGLQFAKEVGLSLMVFDNADELRKISTYYPEARLLLRLRCDDAGSQCPMSGKFGAPSTRWIQLLRLARDLNLSVVGVHFHVGSGCGSRGVFSESIGEAHRLFELSKRFGFAFNILNIGGGFPGVQGDQEAIQQMLAPSIFGTEDDKIAEEGAFRPPCFEELAEEIRIALDRHFPVDSQSDLQILAEPGRYFAAASHTLAVKIYARREPLHKMKNKQSRAPSISGRASPTFRSVSLVPAACPNCAGQTCTCDNEPPVYELERALEAVAAAAQAAVCDQEDQFLYYVNDSLYSSFNCVLFDHASVNPEILIRNKKIAGTLSLCSDILERYPTTIFGQTCDGFDCIMSAVNLPELQTDDWLMFRGMGAYTVAAATTFNGFQPPLKRYVWIVPPNYTAC